MIGWSLDWTLIVHGIMKGAHTRGRDWGRKGAVWHFAILVRPQEKYVLPL